MENVFKYVVAVGKFVGYKGINYHAGCVIEIPAADKQLADDLEKCGTISLIYETTKPAELPKQEDAQCSSTEEK